MSGSNAVLPQRAIDVTFSIKGGGFGDGGQDAVTLSGLKVYAQVAIAGNLAGSIGQFRIVGMTQSMMNRLSVAAPIVNQPSDNVVTVKAGNVGSALSTLFIGAIFEAYIDFSQAPEVAFVVAGLGSAAVAGTPTAPTSFAGGVPAATVLQTIASKAGLTFANYGVTATLQNPYFPGSALDQIDRCCQAIRATHLIEGGVLSIWPDGQGKTDNIPVVSADTGLIGYPSYSPKGVNFQTLFNPQLGFYQTIKLQSEYAPAAWTNQQGQGGAPASNGQWVIVNLTHELQSETPGGPWFTNIEAMLPSLAGTTGPVAA